MASIASQVRVLSPENALNIHGFNRHKENCAGNFGFIRPIRDYELIKLDAFDKEMFEDTINALNPAERIFRYETNTTRISGMRPLVKVNIDRALIYFLDDMSNPEPVFKSRGVKAEYLNIIDWNDEKRN